MRRFAPVLLLIVLAMFVATPGAAAKPKDRIVITGNVNVLPGETVKNVVAFDADTNIAGRVTEDVVVFSGKVTVTGSVGGDVVSFADRAVIGKTARIGGDVIYGDQKPLVAPGAVIGGKTRKANVGDDLGDAITLIGIVLIIGAAIGILLLGLLLIWLAPRAADAMLEPARNAIGPSIGWGFAGLIGLPIVGVLLLVTVIGIPTGAFMLFALLPLCALGYLNGMWLVGRWIIKAPKSRYGAFAIGWLIVTALSLIPFIGSLVGFAAIVYGLGVIVVAVWRARKADEPAVPAPA